MFFSNTIKLLIAPEKRLCVIHFQKSALQKIAKDLKKRKTARYIFLTDEGAYGIYGKTLENILKKEEIDAKFFTIPSGEKYKNLKTIESLTGKMVEQGVNRADTLVGLGGGVIGDLAGFISSIYMRGIPLIQIPTTLLSMVDAAIGGKTGINLPIGKNLLGTFHQPRAIYINQFFLKSLPRNQFMSGIAEVIKYGVIQDKKLFKILEQKKEKILALDEKTLNKILVRCVKIKLDIVSEDERENGRRMILNYGHTIGHAIEKISDFKLSHGEAISIGMVEENNWAVNQGILKEKHADRIKNLIEMYELPTNIPKNIKPDEIKKTMQFDKKRKGKILYLSVPKKIGKTVIVEYK